MKPITVMLAEDHTIVREGLHKMLEIEADIEVVGEAQDGRQAVSLAKKLQPAVILMDIGMPRLNGLEATRQILQELPDTKILMLSAFSDDEHVATAIASGAMGFLLKQTSAHEVCRAIREIAHGGTFFSPDVSRRLNRLRSPAPARPDGLPRKAAGLTSREMEALQLIAEGWANKQIAAELTISVKTVEKHREHLMHKLDIHDTAGLTRYAISAGIIQNSVQPNCF